MTRPTARGLGVFSSTLLLLAFYCLKPDPVLSSATIALTILILSDLAASHVKWRKTCECDANIKERVWVWEKPKIELNVKGYGIIGLEDLPHWLKSKTQVNAEGKFSLKATAVFPHSGNFSIKSLNVLRSSPLKLFLRKERIPCSVEFHVLPETLYWLLEALAILKAGYGAGYSGIGAVKTPASSGLYYETRDYVPGDPIRSIDWKASSRRRKLMIKIFEEESAGGVTLLYDLRGPTPYTCDELASALLSSTIFSYRRSLNVQFISIQEGDVFKPSNPYEAVAFAVRNVLENRVLKVKEFFEYVEPLTLREVEEILSKFLKTGTYKTPHGIIKLENRSNIAISSLLYDTSKLVETASTLKNSGGSLNVITPSKPWRSIGDLEEAYRIYLTYNNVKSKLEKLNAKIVQWKYLKHPPLKVE